MLRFSVLCFELGHVLSCSTKLNSDTESKVSLQYCPEKWTLKLNMNLHVAFLSRNVYIFIIPLHEDLSIAFVLCFVLIDVCIIIA